VAGVFEFAGNEAVAMYRIGAGPKPCFHLEPLDLSVDRSSCV
jgi:hypothetical protein